MDGRSSCPCPCLTITFEKCPVRAPSVPRPCPVRAPPVPRPSCARPCPRMRVWTSTDVCMRRIAILCSTRFRGAPSHFAGGRARSARLLCSTQFSGARLSHFLRLDGRAARGFSAALSLVGRAYRIFCGWTGAQRAASLEIAFAGPSARLALREDAPAWPPRSCGRLPLPGRHARARPYLVATLVPKAFPNVLSKVTGRGTCLLPSHCRRCRLRTSH